MASKHMAQWEIDALLQNVGGAPEKAGAPAVGKGGRKLQPYDFRRPSRFSKEHLRALQTVHEQFARGLGSALSSYLRLNVRVQLTTVEQATLDEYVEQLPNPTVIYILRLPPLDGPVVLELNLAPTLAALDRLCGGPGTLARQDRELTEIERSLLQPLGRYIIRSIADAWLAITPVNPSIEDILVNPRAIRSAGPNEIVALLVLEIAIGDVAGTMSLCLPYVALEPILDRLHTQAWAIEPLRANGESAREQIAARLQSVPLEVVVELGRVELPAAALLSLRAGDVLRLDSSPEGSLPLLVAGVPLFRCRPGVRAGNIAVQIVAG